MVVDVSIFVELKKGVEQIEIKRMSVLKECECE